MDEKNPYFEDISAKIKETKTNVVAMSLKLYNQNKEIKDLRKELIVRQD